MHVSRVYLEYAAVRVRSKHPANEHECRSMRARRPISSARSLCPLRGWPPSRPSPSRPPSSRPSPSLDRARPPPLPSSIIGSMVITCTGAYPQISITDIIHGPPPRPCQAPCRAPLGAVSGGAMAGQREAVQPATGGGDGHVELLLGFGGHARNRVERDAHARLEAVHLDVCRDGEAIILSPLSHVYSKHLMSEAIRGPQMHSYSRSEAIRDAHHLE